MLLNNLQKHFFSTLVRFYMKRVDKILTVKIISTSNFWSSFKAFWRISTYEPIVRNYNIRLLEYWKWEKKLKMAVGASLTFDSIWMYQNLLKFIKIIKLWFRSYNCSSVIGTLNKVVLLFMTIFSMSLYTSCLVLLLHIGVKCLWIGNIWLLWICSLFSDAIN